ncbi:hypothetical protein BJV82DRAFT_625639 [Fennellomyces sp. T-0311]|nr:hypothetical protein BJV82DRAFT_625639 [Fennellomyces sp. T-0311]
MSHHSYARDDDDSSSVEMASPACYMGIVDWDYGFDEFFSDSIAEKRRSCTKGKPKPGTEPATCSKSPPKPQCNATQCSSSCKSQAAPATENCPKSEAQDTSPGPESASSRSRASSVSHDDRDEQKEKDQQNHQSQHDEQGQQTEHKSTEATEAHGSTESFSENGGDVDFDDFGDFDEFGDFEDFEFDQTQDTHAFGALQETWNTVLSQVYLEDKPSEASGGYDELVSSHGPKSIQYYVLEEAHESVHSKITWTSVTYAMDHDTGAPRVKWPRSKIEQMYLSALKYERIETTAPLVPAILAVEDDDTSSDDDSMNMSAEVRPAYVQEQDQQDQHPPSAKSPTGTSVKSPIFGFSFSRFLPRLSTTALPRSDISAPTSATSTQRYSLESIPRTSDATGTTSPGKDYQRSCTSSPIPHTPPQSLVSYAEEVNEHFDLQNDTRRMPDKRFSMPFTNMTPSWAPPPVPEKPKPQRRSMMVNTVLANKDFNLLDFDDTKTVSVPTPPLSSRSFSFKPLVPTPTQPSFPPTPKRDLHSPPLTCATTIEKDLLEFGEFAEAGDDFGDFVSNEEEEWGDWNGSTTTAIKIN